MIMAESTETLSADDLLSLARKLPKGEQLRLARMLLEPDSETGDDLLAKRHAGLGRYAGHGWIATANLLVPLAVLLAACGPAPRGAGDPGEPSISAASPAPTIYVALAEPPEAPAARPKPAARHDENPFERVRTWIGDYECPQGRTKLWLHVGQIDDARLTAVFDFNHAASGAAGQYLLEGSYDKKTRKATFSPGEWLSQPPGYVSVGMTGVVAPDGSLFTGTIDEPACGDFRLRPAGPSD